MSLSTVRSELLSIVSAFKGDSQPLNAAFDYMPATLDETPAACVIFDKASEEFATIGGQNTLQAEFIIRIIVENTTNYSAQSDLMLSIIDSILGALRSRSNITLDNNVQSTLVTGVSEMFSSLLGSISVLYVDISVRTRGLKST